MTETASHSTGSGQAPSTSPVQVFPSRVYPLDPRKLTEEQIAVAFAMTSRSPEAFDEIAKQVSAEKAASFSEKWIVGYGHASVAEHAMLHMAVENISRLACDTLEDNRLASYTEKSSRYQILTKGSYHVPGELSKQPPLRDLYIKTCDQLFDTYLALLSSTQAYLKQEDPKKANEREGAYNLRIRRIATDVCRFILPASTLTNVGVTLNARSMENAIRKLLAAELIEEREIGELLKEQGRTITPTLIKYAEPTPFLKSAMATRSKAQAAGLQQAMVQPKSTAKLVHYDPQGEQKVVAALLFTSSHRSYQEAWDAAGRMNTEQRAAAIGTKEGHWNELGQFDAPGREAELPYYTFELTMDYGAYREFKRHRMQTYLAQPLTVAHGVVTPDLITESGMTPVYRDAVGAAEDAYRRMAKASPAVAQYVVTHAHRRRVLAHMNLRECYSLFKLRTGPQAHFTLREVMEDALQQATAVHPGLFGYLKRRDR
ncbi:MAG: hypothetical protein EXR67_06865 [Dehalococcoidia bacterium]|nr:hypothetical protein [Dehalococcoidia bacterium]